MESLPETRICRKCGAERPLAEFRVRFKDGHRYIEYSCQECRRAYNRIQSKRFTENNREKLKAQYQANKERYRRNHISRKYKISLQAVEAMLIRQDWKCAICGNALIGAKRPYHIDHCHDTHVVRGALCNNCNLGLGHFRDNPSLLENAIEYLSHHARKYECGHDS